jgi:hypothetical protein
MMLYLFAVLFAVFLALPAAAEPGGSQDRESRINARESKASGNQTPYGFTQDVLLGTGPKGAEGGHAFNQPVGRDNTDARGAKGANANTGSRGARGE